MFNEKDILARLQNGEDAQTIADEMAKLLNSAIDEQKKIQEAEAEKRAKEAEKAKLNEQKIADMKAILADLETWFSVYYGDVYEDGTIAEVFKNEITADWVVEMIDEVNASISALTSLVKPKTKKPKCECKKKIVINPDDVLNTFLKDMGW